MVTGGIIAALFAGVLTVAALYVRSTRALLRQSLALERTNAELARSVADLDQFASIASHDLQEPLRGITMYLDLLEVRQGSRLTEVGLGYVRQAVTSANRMGDLITALLTYARATGRREPEPVDAAAAAREAIGNLRARIEEMRAEIEIGELPWVSASHVQLVGVFQNLIGNGIKFCDGQPRVQVAADRIGDDWEFSVRDNGIGISPEAASRLFRLFQRLEPTRFAGTGIGLITCKRIIEEFGGRIWLTSTPGAGSTFRFTLKGAQAPG
jgi:light-regulated signal transduction histidine kinase (bacteriophytochrome)